MRIGCGAGDDFAEKHGEGYSVEMRVFGFGCGIPEGAFTAGELGLEDFVERKLDGHMGEAKEGRGKAGVKGEDAFVPVHLAEGVGSAFVVPWSFVVSPGASGVGLGH